MTNTFNKLLDDVDANGYAIVDDFIHSASVNELLQHAQSALANGEFKQAGIGRQSEFQTNDAIRNDLVMWLTQQTIHEWCPELANKLNALMDFLNNVCYAGLNQSEFHLANYAPGAFYKRHLDRFKNTNERRFTVIVYLNRTWTQSDGGQLVVYGKNGDKEIHPIAGRLVFFNSGDLEHEVLMSHNSRWSFTGWLKTLQLPQSCCSTNY
jgi:SM-20-related protein